MTALIRAGMLFSGCFIAFSVNAFEIAAEFSAEAVQSIPGRQSTNVKMFISKKAVRTESIMNGNTIVEIVYPKEKRRVLLNQPRKTYIEQKAQTNKSQKVKKLKNSPCDGIANATCKKLGGEKINGRDANKWEMNVQRNGQNFKSLHWLDKKRYMPLREQWHDGTVTTMTMLGKEKVNGRNTEKWQLHSIRPNGQFMDSQQWYDTKLKMVIREMLPGGYVRELCNIKVARQNKKLFNIPSDYKKEEMPMMAPSQNRVPNRQPPARMNSRNTNQRMINQGSHR